MGAIVVSPLIHHVAAHPLPSNVQILLIDRRIHFADSKARPAALFFVSRKGGGRRQERFDHLHRYCDSGIAITSLARMRNDLRRS